ncbi:MAG TPA: response regulator transcription factor [Puia sp.]|jgi:DNA-binding LytR/AlgR family response regulator|nr:response regulator transcription factor [Puia sp.]
MTDIRCLVVDDEPLAIDVIVTYLQQLNIRQIATANNAIEAFRQLQQEPVDLLFLDIQMPQLTGFDLLKSLPHRPLVVITTAYRDYAVEGFEWEALDYLVKPFSFARFLQMMNKASRARETPPLNEHKDAIFLKNDRHLARIGIVSILYIESLKDYIRVFTTGGDYLCHQSLTDITSRLPADKFLRVHRSYTLALDKIDQVRQHCAHIGTKTIPISRAHRQELYRRLDK